MYNFHLFLQTETWKIGFYLKNYIYWKFHFFKIESLEHLKNLPKSKWSDCTPSIPVSVDLNELKATLERIRSVGLIGVLNPMKTSPRMDTRRAVFRILTYAYL